jgi:thiol-disulfide isomerase/thioredoxin
MKRSAGWAALSAAVLFVAAPGWSAYGAPVPAAPRLIPAEASAIKKAIESSGGTAVLVNIWATWCVPCREEFGDVLKVRHDLAGRGLKVLFVSADFDDARDDALRFLGERGVDFPSYWKVGRDEDFIAALAPEWSGVLPATLIYDGHGRLAKILEGKQSYETFRDQAIQVIEQGRNTK